MAVLFIFLYLLNGQAVVEKALYKSVEECIRWGTATVEQVMLDKPESMPLYGQCIRVQAQEVSSSAPQTNS